MRLSIVIPALNEEAAIAGIIERTLAAGGVIIEQSPIRRVEVIVVNDGSTDRTGAIAAEFAARGEIALVNFDTNRGYGAAIKAGFERGRGELVGFLDADGTCDPAFFATLCNALTQERADVAIGSRLHEESRMPRIRRLGNRVYATILGLLSNRCVTDTASGMRVIRRDVLPRLYPLPDRLDFTPAMSARVLMDEALRIVERPMPYHERVGRSKLSVLRDGVRFLQTIGHMALMWNPGRVFGLTAGACFLVMTLLALHPVETWLRAGRIGEDTIYRLLFCMWLGCVGGALLSANVVARALSEWIGARTKSAPSAPRRVDEAAADAALLVTNAHRADCDRIAAAPATNGSTDYPPESAGASCSRPPSNVGDEARPSGHTYLQHLLDRVYTLRGVGVVSAAAMLPLAWLIGPGVWTRMTEGHVAIHWSRVVLAGLIAFSIVQMLTATLVVNVIRFHTRRASMAALSATTAVRRNVSIETRTADEADLLPTA